MKALLKKLFVHPLAASVDIETAESIAVHRQIIQSKKLLRLVYDFWYKEMMRGLEPTKHLEGLAIVELGSGASFIEQYIPSVIKTDVVYNPNAQDIVNGEKMPYADNSVRLLLLTHVLHHMHSAELFLKEALRCLAPGGRIVMIEAATSPLGKLVTRYCNPHEYYDTAITTWENPVESRMTQANLALAWVMFFRDRKLYDQKFPDLPVREIRRHTLLSYYASGGVLYRNPVPDFLAGAVWKCEQLFAYLFPSQCVQMTVQLEKTA